MSAGNWTSDLNEINTLHGMSAHIAQIIGSAVSITLSNGTSLEGDLLPGKFVSRIGPSSRWEYRGTIVIRTQADDIEVDYLDVTQIAAPPPPAPEFPRLVHT